MLDSFIKDEIVLSDQDNFNDITCFDQSTLKHLPGFTYLWSHTSAIAKLAVILTSNLFLTIKGTHIIPW